MFNKKKKNNKGFTLVELLVVIAIIGILAVVAVPSLFKQIDKAKATQVVTNIKAIKTEILTEYANSSTDDAVRDNVNAYIKKEIVDKKLGESYAVSVSSAGSINIVVNLDSKYDSIAKNIATQLGGQAGQTSTGEPATVTGSTITYTVTK